jgi:hypothetical protein
VVRDSSAKNALTEVGEVVIEAAGVEGEVCW